MRRLNTLALLLVCSLLFALPTLAQDALEGEGELNDATPSEEYELQLEAGQVITVTTEATSGTLDTVLTLFDPSGRRVAENDDRGDGTYNSQIVYEVERSGVYIIEVSRYDNTTRGQYIVRVEFGTAAPPASTVSAQGETEVLEGEGRLNNAIQSERYSVELREGQTIHVFTEATSGTLDTVLFLYDPSGREVASNDDRGDGTYNSEITYTAQTTGTFTIEVTRYDNTTQGDYIVTVEISASESFVSAEELFGGDGRIDDATETESWEIALTAGSIIVISTERTTGNLDTTLELYDPDGNLILFNDDRGDGTFNSAITYEVTEDGTYVIVVGRYDDSSSGDYTISVAIDPTAQPDFSYVNVEGEIIDQFSGTIDNLTTEIKFQVELTAGQSIYAAADATSGNLDTVLSLFTPGGLLVAVNDDRGDGTLNSAIAFTVEESGTYTLVVSRYDGSVTTGSFVVVVQTVDVSVVDQIEQESTQVVSLSGPVEVIETNHFRIHYTLAGTDATTPEYVRSFAETLEEMYDVQINQLGWAAPPSGPDGMYDAYLADVIGTERGALGYARPLSLIGDNPNSPLIERNAADSVLVVDNDYYIEGANINAQALMRATTTHEFNHMIQFGYDAEESFFWLFEATATWMETISVGDEQDATGYIEQNNQYPELCFATAEQDGGLAYGDWTFLESMADRHGEAFVRRLWENAIEYEGITILDETLSEVGETLAEAAAIWRAQNLAMDYDLAPLFPRPVWLENTIRSFGSWTYTGAGVQELGANYFDLRVDGAINLSLNGTDELELWVIGIDGDRADVTPLGAGGTVDLTGYDHRYVMVFHKQAPRDIENCDYLDYTIDVSEGTAAEAITPTINFNAANFQPLS